MSPNIPPLAPIAAVAAGGAARQPAAAPHAPAASDADSVEVDTMPAGPPPEVQREMAAAAEVYDRLATQGRTISFQPDERTGHLSVVVQDLAGNALFTLPPSRALEIASGGALE